MDTPQFAVMICGKWGCGKTYYIKEQIKTWQKDKVKTKDDEISLKPVYVSVNGLSSISAIVRRIRTVLHPILYSKGTKVAKKIFFTALNIATKASLDLDGDGTGEDFNSLCDAEGMLELFKSDSDSIKGNRVLVIDDLERCKIHLDELFGFINNITEHSNSKVILICNEDKLREVVKKENLSIEYDRFKEKLVGQTFAFAVDYPIIAGHFIDKKAPELFSDKKALLIELFSASKHKNLRLVKHCLIDIERFFASLPTEIKKNPNFKCFALNVTSYLTIVSLELRSGNSNVQYFQSYTIISDENRHAGEEIEQRYNPVLMQFGLYHSSITISIPNLITFVQNGYIDNIKELVQTCSILQSRNVENWEKLWHYSSLSNEEFLDVYKKEKARFYNKELSYVYEVVHLAGIFLMLEKKKLVRLSRKKIVSTAKSNVRRIHQEFPNSFPHIANLSKGHSTQELDSSEMTEITNFVSNLYNENNRSLEFQYVQTIWNGLGTDVTCQDLEEWFDKSTPTRRCKYAQEAIFTQVSAKKLAEKIAALSNKAKIEFSNFLVHRYYLKGSYISGALSTELKKEKDALTGISSHLKSKAGHLRLIDKEMTLLIASKLDEAAEKMGK